MPVVNPDSTPRSNDALTPGLHTARILSCEEKTSKTGNTYLNWKFEVGNSRKWVFMATGLSGKGLENFKSIVRAAKYPNYVGGSVDTDELIGAMVNVTIDYEPGNEYPRVVEVSANLDGPDFDDANL